MRAKFDTPAFNPSDPIVCHSLALRPSLWAVFWYVLQELGHAHEWRQVSPADATPEEVSDEITKALDTMIFQGCLMIGQIIELAVDDIPDWLLPCDGQTYLNADYPDLAAVIHSAFVVSGTEFRTPDRNVRFGIGGTSVGTQGGEIEHTLTAAEMPSHNHSVQGATTAASVVLGELPGFEATEFTQITSNAGGGNPHNNMPPYEQTQFYIIAKYPTAG